MRGTQPAVLVTLIIIIIIALAALSKQVVTLHIMTRFAFIYPTEFSSVDCDYWADRS